MIHLNPISNVFFILLSYVEMLKQLRLFFSLLHGCQRNGPGRLRPIIFENIIEKIKWTVWNNFTDIDMLKHIFNFKKFMALGWHPIIFWKMVNRSLVQRILGRVFCQILVWFSTIEKMIRQKEPPLFLRFHVISLKSCHCSLQNKEREKNLFLGWIILKPNYCSIPWPSKFATTKHKHKHVPVILYINL